MEDSPKTENATFYIELAGRIIEGRERDEVLQALARLFRITPERAQRLLANRPVIIKRGLNEEQAQHYISSIRRAGAVCGMVPEQPPVSTCPKCGYTAVHAKDKLVAHDECPACGIIVGKYLKAREQNPPQEQEQSRAQDAPADEPAPPSDTPDPPIFKDEDFVSFPKRGPLVSLFGFCPLENPLRLKAAPAELPTASVYHRFWASVATFCHCVFMGLVMQVPVGIAGGIYLLNNDMELTRTTADALRGLSMLLGFAYVTIVLPVLWNGHTYGMRAMRIVLVDRRYEHEIGLSPGGSFLRVLAGMAKWIALLPLAVPLFNRDGDGFEDLVMKTRQAALDSSPARPWNIALRPLAAALVLILVIGLPGSCMLSAFSGQPGAGTRSALRAPERPDFRAGFGQDGSTGVSPGNRAMLTQLRAAVMQHVAETGSLPETPGKFEKMLSRSFSQGSPFTELYLEDELDFHAGFDSFELGLRQGDAWAVIDQDGRVSVRDDF